MPKKYLKDVAGLRFGRYTILKRISGGRGVRVLCRCDCGVEKELGMSDLRRGTTVSCGCYSREVHTKHGKRHTAEYNIWCGIKKRCSNPKEKSWKNYGGRGITVCERWSEFENFIADMGPKPTSNHSLDRIDNNGNYEPSNCRWATVEQQVSNKRSNVFIVVNGLKLTLAQWERRLTLKKGTLHRWMRRGWSEQEIIMEISNATP